MCQKINARDGGVGVNYLTDNMFNKKILQKSILSVIYIHLNMTCINKVNDFKDTKFKEGEEKHIV